MKINVEIDLTPEELRRFMGLPDVAGVHQQMLESFTENMVLTSQEQQQEFFKSVISGSFAPWQSFFSALNPAVKPGGDR